MDILDKISCDFMKQNGIDLIAFKIVAILVQVNSHGWTHSGLNVFLNENYGNGPTEKYSPLVEKIEKYSP